MSKEEEEELKPDDFESLSPEEQIQYHKWVEEYGFPQAEEKVGFFELFNRIIKGVRTTKTSALDENEINAVRNPMGGAVVTNIFEFPLLTLYLEKKSEVIFASALSGSKRKPGALLQAMITQRRQLETKASKDKKSGGLFAKKENE